MASSDPILSATVREAARRSVLCWLATVDAQGQPHVSPKEVWTIADDVHVAVAHIASPVSARNIVQQPQVCLSFVDVFGGMPERSFAAAGRANGSMSRMMSGRCRQAALMCRHRDNS